MKHKYASPCFFLAFILLLSFFAGIFLSSEHTCMDDGCSICLFLSAMEQLLRLALPQTAGAALFAFIELWRRTHFRQGHDPIPSPKTPIDLKVKLSN